MIYDTEIFAYSAKSTFELHNIVLLFGIFPITLLLGFSVKQEMSEAHDIIKKFDVTNSTNFGSNGNDYYSLLIVAGMSVLLPFRS